jgi:predicted CoA-binding protein
MANEIADILNESRTVAIVGLSSKWERDSNIVGKYLKEQGYKIVPVNPGEKEILGETSYPDLLSIPVKIDVVDIFRKPEDVPPIVRQAIQIGAKVVWMQEGIVNEAAAAEARRAGLKAIMDTCMRKQHIRLHGGEA